MTKTYKYVTVITGIVHGRNRANAYIQAAMGVNLSARLLQTPHDIAIEVREVKSGEGEGSKKEDGKKDANQVPPFNLPVAPEGQDASNAR